MDLLVTGADMVATLDESRREIAGGWVAIAGGLIAAVGGPGEAPPAAATVLRANGCLVTPGLINTHHHIFQNLTRSYRPAVNGSLFTWLSTLYPLWAGLDEEASLPLGVGRPGRAGPRRLHHHDRSPLRPSPRRRRPDLGRDHRGPELGMRFHPTRGSMSLSQKDGGLPPDSVVQDDDEILADSERLVAQHHDRSWGAMVRIALAPCSPFSVTPELMRATAELAERLDVRLHTHLAEDPDEDSFAAASFGMRTIEHFEQVGWLTDRSWVAHCIYPDPAEVARLGAAGVGVAHCPSSNMLIGGGGMAPVAELRAAGAPVGLGCDGSASTDHASLWLEARGALLLGRQRKGATGMTARDALEIATRGSAACLGRLGELGVLAPGAVADVVCWPLDGIAFAGALTDPIEAWLRCGPVAARHTVVAGVAVVADGELVAGGVDDMLRRHRVVAARLQGLS